MKIDDILKGCGNVPQAQDHLVTYLNGGIESDHDQVYFRIYRDPRNRRSYVLLRKADVAGDIYEWTADEIREAGYVGAKVFRVPIRFGTEIQGVSIKVHKVGNPIGQKARGCEDGDVCCCNAGCTPPCNCTDDPDACDQVGEICADSKCEG